MTAVSRVEQPKAPVSKVVPMPAAILNGADLAKPLPPIPWVCERLELAPGAVNIWAGYGYSGKTLAAQELLISVAAGKLVWGGLPCKTGNVMHLDYEQGRRLTSERYQRLCRASDVDLVELGDRIKAVPFPPLYLDTDAGLKWLETICADVTLCVVDSLRASLPTVDENASDVRKYLDPLARVSERTACTFVLIHHGRKRGEKDHGAAQSVRGSSAIFDACQSVCVFEGKRGEPSTVSLEKARITGSAHDDVSLVFEDTPGPSPDSDGRDDAKWGLRVRMQRAGVSNGLSDVRAAILETVRAKPGLSKRAVVSETTGRAPVLWDVLEDLIEDGQLRTAPRAGRGGGIAVYLPLENKDPGEGITWDN